jgi:hypothetical protein
MRGSAFDSVFLPVIILVILIVGIFTVYSSSLIMDAFETKMKDEAPELDDEFTELFDSAGTVVDIGAAAIPVVAFFLFVVSWITSYLTPNHPIFLFFAIFLLAAGIGVTLISKTVYDEIVAADTDFAEQIPFAAWYFQNSPMILTVVGAINLFLMYYGYMQTGGGYG